MAKFVCSFTIFIVAASVQKLTNCELFKQESKNDAKNDWRLDENQRRDQRQWVVNNKDDGASNAFSDFSKLKIKLNALEHLVQQGLPVAHKPIKISLHPSQIQKPGQSAHMYNPNIYYPGVIDRLENSTSVYNDIPHRKREKPSPLDNALKGNTLFNLYLGNLGEQTMVQHLDTKDSSETIEATRRPSIFDSADPGDGEGWFNYPITRPDAPNPAWHLSTIRTIYKPRRIFKRSPKRKSPKKKKNRDETKKFNKKKKIRRKMRILISGKKRPKTKKGDGSYRGGIGQKPRLHRKKSNETRKAFPKYVHGDNVKNETEGPVADAYIDYDSSYEPPEGSGDSEEEEEMSCEDEEEGSGDDDDDIDSEADENMSEAYEPSEENGGSSETDKKNDTRRASGRSNIKHKVNALKKADVKQKTGKIKKRSKKLRMESKIHLERNKAQKVSAIETEGKDNNILEGNLLTHNEPRHYEETVVHRIMVQQRQHPNSHASILIHPFEADMLENNVQSQTKVNVHKMNSKLRMNDKYGNNKIQTHAGEEHARKSKLQIKHKDAMKGTLSDIAENLVRARDNVHDNKDNVHSRLESKATYEQINKLTNKMSVQRA